MNSQRAEVSNLKWSYAEFFCSKYEIAMCEHFLRTLQATKKKNNKKNKGGKGSGCNAE